MMPKPDHYSILAEFEGVTMMVSLCIITLSGLVNEHWNGDYVQRPGKVFEMFDDPTYWSRDCSRVLYFHQPSRSWTLAPASVWADWSMGYQIDSSFGYAPADACLRGWYETSGNFIPAAAIGCPLYAPEGAIVWKEGAGIKGIRKEDVNVHGRMESLLSRIPRGHEVFRLAKADCKRWRRLLQFCRLLNELPADDGFKSEDLQVSRHALDVAFSQACADILRAAERKRQMEVARQMKFLQRLEAQRLEKQSRMMAAELIAEEEMEKKRNLIKQNPSKKKPKAPKKKEQQAFTPSVAETSGNLQELQDSQEDFDQLKGSPDPSGFALREDVSDAIIQLRHNFPMFDDDVLCNHFMEADYDLEKAVMSLSKLEAEPVAILEPVQDIPLHPQPRVRKEAPKRLMANVVARTDHAHLPLYCFIAVVAKSEQSQKYRPGQLVRPIPEDRFRLLGDEKGHFWLKKTKVPQVGDIVEVCFYEEDTHDYLRMAHGKYPHQNEDLLCTTLTLHTRCDLEKNDPCLKCA